MQLNQINDPLVRKKALLATTYKIEGFRYNWRCKACKAMRFLNDICLGCGTEVTDQDKQIEEVYRVD